MSAVNLDKISDREKSWILVALFCVIAVMLDYLVVSPVIEKFKVLDARIAKEEFALNKNQSVMQHRKTVEVEYAAVKGQFEEFSVSAKAIEGMKGQIQDVASRNQLVIISSEDREPSEGKYCDEYGFELKQFKTTVSQLLDLLYELHKTPGMLQVDRLTLNRPSQEAGRQLEGSMLITKKMIRGE